MIPIYAFQIAVSKNETISFLVAKDYYCSLGKKCSIHLSNLHDNVFRF
jgi:hypothetical protein